MRGLALLRRGWAAIRRMYPALVAALVVTALAMTLYGVSQARQHTRVSGTANVADATPTSVTTTTVTTAVATATATDQPPISGPTPTHQPNEQLIPPSNGSGSFTVESVVIPVACVGGCPIVSTCPTATAPTFPIGGIIWLAPNAPDGDVTYRWLPSYGPPTAPQIIHFGGGIASVAPSITLAPGVSMTGHPFSVRLETLSPNEMISQPSETFSFTCLPEIKNLYVSPTSDRSYDCQAGGSQSFAYTASLDIVTSPSYSISYYWKRSDGSVSQTWTTTTTAWATSVSLHGDSISLIAPSPPPPVGPLPVAYYWDTAVVQNTPATVNGSGAKQFIQQGADVVMPNCSDKPAPTPTATAAPTSTPLPTATPPPTPTATP